MKLVQQPKDSQLCLACCCAMIANQTLEEVLAEVTLTPLNFPGVPDFEYLTIQDAIRYLLTKGLWLGGEIRIGFVDHWDGTARIDLMETPALVTMPSKNYRSCLHCIVYDHISEMYFDPQQSEPFYTVPFAGEVHWSIVSKIS